MKAGLYLKELLARLKGDQVEVNASRNARLAEAAFKGNLSSLEDKLIKAEISVEEKEEALNNAILSVDAEGKLIPITDSEVFLRKIFDARTSLEKANADLKKVQDAIDFWTNMSVKSTVASTSK